MIGEKTCSTCKQVKPLEAYHAHPRGLLGRHSQCKECHNEAKRRRRKERGPDNPQIKRALLLKQRYGMTVADYDAKMDEQGGVCAICEKVPLRPCVDHNHDTGQVRGILCHGCNIKLPAVEDESFHARAIQYLEGHAA